MRKVPLFYEPCEFLRSKLRTFPERKFTAVPYLEKIDFSFVVRKAEVIVMIRSTSKYPEK